MCQVTTNGRPCAAVFGGWCPAQQRSEGQVGSAFAESCVAGKRAMDLITSSWRARLPHGQFQNAAPATITAWESEVQPIINSFRTWLSAAVLSVQHPIDPNLLVFRTKKGPPWDANLLVKRKLRPLCEKLGIAPRGLHARNWWSEIHGKTSP